MICIALHNFGFTCSKASDYDALDDALKVYDIFDIVLMDITGFDVGIWARCKNIHQQNIPLLILSAKPSAALQQHGMRYGAKGIIKKPVILKDFVNLIYLFINDEHEE